MWNTIAQYALGMFPPDDLTKLHQWAVRVSMCLVITFSMMFVLWLLHIGLAPGPFKDLNSVRVSDLISITSAIKDVENAVKLDQDERKNWTKFQLEAMINMSRTRFCLPTTKGVERTQYSDFIMKLEDQYRALNSGRQYPMPACADLIGDTAVGPFNQFGESDGRTTR